MKYKLHFEQKYLSVYLIILSAFFLVAMLTINRIGRKSDVGIWNLKTRSEDGQIVIFWDENVANKDYDIEIMVSSKDRNEKILLKGNETSYSFSHGTHGYRYDFSVRLLGPDGYVDEGISTIAMFLRWDELPDLPLVKIETVNGEKPTYTIAEPGNYGMASTIENNDYLLAYFMIDNQIGATVKCAAEIRVRGNSSAIMLSKKPYKIKLDQALDLMVRGDEKFKDREWLLLPVDDSYSTAVGMEMARLVGMEWVPAHRTVNVMLNGDWLGMYDIVESVKCSESRLNITNTGFLVENDAFYWNEDFYFKTPYQYNTFGWTFKYPKIASISDEDLQRIQTYMENYSSAWYTGCEDYTKYVDQDTFASWLLAHDILGTGDGAGANMYLYKESMDSENVFSSKLKMGPLWDFTSIFRQKDIWAVIHDLPIMPFYKMLRDDEFRNTYYAKWKEVSGSLVEDMQMHLKLYFLDEKAFQESVDLESARWDTELPSIQSVKLRIDEWFKTRIAWMEQAMLELS